MAGEPAGPVHFLGIGAQKAGTTWLYEHLAAHPGVRFPAGKELHFWSRRQGRPEEAWLERFPPCPPEMRQGEITPAYALLEPEAIARIAALCPGVRVFYSARNPLERAWSSALMALERAELELHEASDAWFEDHFRSRGSRARGDAAATLARWEAALDPGALEVILFDDLVRDPRSVLRRLAAHLGVDPDFYDGPSLESLRRPVFPGRGAALRPSLVPGLRALYEGPVHALEERLGRDLSPWLDLAPAAPDPLWEAPR